MWMPKPESHLSDLGIHITVEELIGGNEYFERNGFKNEISVDKNAVIETLSKGFFTRYSNDSADISVSVSVFEERQQVGVELIFVRVCQSVGCAGIDF